jgi:predicted ATPase
VAGDEVPAPGPGSPRPHIAGVYDYLLGGTDNSAADRALGDQILAAVPDVQAGVRAQRAVLDRAVRYLAGAAGIRQFLDIGSGLPTADNVHQIAQRIDPAARVVYVDNDPGVVAQAQARKP